MDRLVDGAVGVLDLAGAASPIPYVGAAAVVVRAITDHARQIAINKRKCSLLVERCTTLQNTLQDHSQTLLGTGKLQEVADSVDYVLDKVRQRVIQWSKYSAVKCWFKVKEIDDGLQQCISDVENSMQFFSLNTSMLLHQAQRQNSDALQSNHTEVMELLLRIISSPQERQILAEMQEDGQHAAEQIMHAGQVQLRRLRNQAPGTHTHSPEPMDTPSPAEFGSSSNMITQQTHLSPSRPSPHPSPTHRTSAFSSQPPNPIHDSQEYLAYQRGLLLLHRETGIPPTIKRLDGEIERTGDVPILGGTYSDVYMGTWLGGEKVALKALRGVRLSSKALQRFEHEINIWSTLDHSNILAFYGIVTSLGQGLHMVSPWQDNGNVIVHITHHPDVDRISLMEGAARGIEYLHGKGITHGNVKCANILVNSEGRACICDFGMSRVMEDITGCAASTTLTSNGGSARWLAPELIADSKSSSASDTYSFAMAILECITLQPPYCEHRRDAAVISEVVIKRKLPQRPTGVDAEGREVGRWLHDELWEQMVRCWAYDAAARPPMQLVVATLIRVREAYGGMEEAMDLSA